MAEILVCNTGTDTISKINIDDLSVEEISLGKGEKPMGPFGICDIGEEVVVTNTYNNSLKFINKKSFMVVNDIYIGEGPKVVKKYLDKMIITCSESNSLTLFDLEYKEVVGIVREFNYPYKIEGDLGRKLIYICNLFSDRVDILNYDNFESKGSIKTVGRPTDIKKSNCGRYLLITEDNLEEGEGGYLNIYDIETLKRIKSVSVGRIPSNIEESDEFIFVTNFGDGTINIIDLNKLDKRYTLEVGGMPICTIIYDDNIFICDYEGNKVMVLDKYYRMRKNIAVGSEPNAMLLINPYH